MNSTQVSPFPPSFLGSIGWLEWAGVGNSIGGQYHNLVNQISFAVHLPLVSI